MKVGKINYYNVSNKNNKSIDKFVCDDGCKNQIKIKAI